MTVGAASHGWTKGVVGWTVFFSGVTNESKASDMVTWIGGHTQSKESKQPVLTRAILHV